MKVLSLVFIVSIFIVGFILKGKKIKDVKIFKISIITIMGIVYISAIIIVEFIIPLPTYYIKPKDYRYIENIIEDEMTKSNIIHDKDSVKIRDQFIGKYNQLYLTSYEVDGQEEARMFDFKVNIFGNLKPKHDFSESAIILKDELDDGRNYRIIADGIPAFYIEYGYANNPEEFKNRGVGEFVVGSINPDEYYLLAKRDDDWSPIQLRFGILFIALFVMYKMEKKRSFYSETKFIGKKRFPYEVEYYY